MLPFSLFWCLTAGIEILPWRRKKNIAIQGGVSWVLVQTEWRFPPREIWTIQAVTSIVDSWSKSPPSESVVVQVRGPLDPWSLTPCRPPAGWVAFFRVGGGSSCLECGHPDDVGLGVVGGAGWIIAFGCGAGRCGHADDSGGDVRLVTVQRNRLFKFGVQAGSTGTTTETEETGLVKAQQTDI